MGATSVTGLVNNGAGAADAYAAGNKGSERMSLGVHRLIGPRVVGCGEVMLDASGGGLVVYPALPGGTKLYCPFLSSSSSTAPYWGNFTVTSFGVTGGASGEVCWQIVKHGLWGSLENDGPSSVIANT
jgi:hypothetical protein